MPIACIIARPAADSLRPLVPRGYVLLTEAGFRKVLTERAELLSCSSLIRNKDSVILQQNVKYALNDKLHNDTRKVLEKQLKAIKKQVFISKIERWVLRGVAVVLAVKILIR